MLCGQFTPTADMIAGPRRVAIRRRATVVEEPEQLDTFDGEVVGPGDQVIRFKDIRDAFVSLKSWDRRLRSELLRTMKPRERQLVERTANSVIGVHVRRGDFDSVSESGLARPRVLVGPFGRQRGGSQGAFKSCANCSDGLPPSSLSQTARHTNLDPLLALDEVTILRGGSPISDMLALSNARI
jgi:hypothetical protein